MYLYAIQRRSYYFKFTNLYKQTNMKTNLLVFLMLLGFSGLMAQTECKVEIVYTANKVLPLTYSFVTNPQIEGAKYYWAFSDKTVSDSPTPMHEFKSTDTYVIEVKVTKSDGSACYGRIEARFEGSTPTPVILSSKGKVIEKTGCGLVITIENTTTLVPVEIVPEFTLKPGQYVELAYELLDKASECGKVAKIHKIVEIAQVCNVPVTYTKGDKVGFYKFQTTEQPTGTTYKWYFSDNTISDSPAPVHEFKTSGSYVVELVVIKPDQTKCNGRIEARFDGSTPTPDGCRFDIVVKPKEAAPYTFIFYAIGSREIKTVKWNFGDGKYSDEKNPEHTYEKQGTYEISCSIVTVDECTNAISIKHTVLSTSLPVCPGPINLILFDPVDNKCNGKATVKLLNENAGIIDNVKYIWSDGQTGSTVEALCSDKTYYVLAIIEGVCQKNTSFTMLSKPVWSVTTINGINNFKVIEPKSGVEYEWDFGNGVKLKGAQVSFNFEKAGIYDVKLTAVADAANSEFSQQIVVMKTVTGTSVINKSEIQIYPNPAREMLNINLGNPVENDLFLDISSMVGKKVISQKLDVSGSGQAKINIHSLKQGIYFLRITSGNQLITYLKFIKTE